MTKKCLKMAFFHIKSQKFAGDGRWVSYIPKCALNYDWLHGKGLILRTLEDSSHGGAKTWTIGEKGEKLCTCQDSTRLKGFSPKHDLNTFEFLIFQQ